MNSPFVRKISSFNLCTRFFTMSNKGRKRKANYSDTESLRVNIKEECVSDEVSSIHDSRTNIAESVEHFNFNKKRVRILTKSKEIKENCECVVYWMSRDARVQDNWSMLYAQKISLKFKVPLRVCFCLVPTFLNATSRQYHFLIEGLKEVERECIALNIPFHLLLGQPPQVLTHFVEKHKTGAVIADFSPLRIMKKWINELTENFPNDVPICQVDSHNIVPCWVASDKLEYAARTIRKKINDKLPEFLTYFPPVIRSPFQCEICSNDWQKAELSLDVVKSDKVNWAIPGTTAGLQMLKSFCETRLKGYATLRNNPNYDNLSNLSPWFHFGQISVQRAILEVKKYQNKFNDSVLAFIEEAVVRRELSDNFCYYNENYDNLNGAWQWAQDTLKKHETDKREHIYSKEQLENAETFDPLWNASQIQLVKEGKMHGFLRMYWAKKILEWTNSPSEALEISIYLNDKYNLDGRDPNGYVGCMWSICGVHDMGWKERPIFGKIRYMNFEGCKRKFNVNEFINKYKK
ncbi:Deoxyribodipyrimidine photo-lyase-like protein [Leptotrombidium deliense]|uniref:Deoxyribodipyrimidine photo-lyase n=1 Tax=Leptotrombidium deliense TaxID=299467 RepID=A0A443SVI3_9ACAR|nr:Deoxyribodipyrimidine photo-lyase-like protein [Leptotrombidium deliense]